MKALRIPVDTSVPVTVVELNGAPEIQAAIGGGWLEGIGGVFSEGSGWFAYLDEEGKLKGLRPNWRATWLVASLGRPGDVLVGPVVFFGPPDLSGNETDVPDHVLKSIGAWGQ